MAPSVIVFVRYWLSCLVAWAREETQFGCQTKNMYQNRPSQSHQLPFDKGIQIVIPPRSLASVPEPIGTPFDGILHRSE